MIEAYAEALAFVFQPMTLLIMLAAVIGGLIIGVIPGISGLVGLTLLLPFIFRMPAEIGLTILVALQIVTFTGGSITAILVNVPGVGTSVATLLDGYPMSQRGEGARAMGAAIAASTAGGIMPVFLVAPTIPLLLPILMSFKSPEMTILVVVGLSFISVLTGRSAIKGLISGYLGMFLSLIGYQGSTGLFRFTFGSIYLSGGISIVIVALGLFGLSELLNMSLKRQATISVGKVAARYSDAFQGVKDVWLHKWLWFRCALIGYVVGLIPGVGAETSIWVAYGQAKQTSKHPELFGTGIVEGVIAPESANNSKEPGSLLTTLAFGIPGSVIGVIFLSAFLLVGITPGPKMLIDHLPLALTLFIGMAVACLMGGVIAFLFAPILAKAASVHIDFLFPIILVLLVVGAYLTRNDVLAFVELISFGLLGLVMTVFGYPKPPLLLGFVLGRLLEHYLWLSYKTAGPLFFTSPISLFLMAVLALTLSYPYLKMKVLPGIQRMLKN